MLGREFSDAAEPPAQILAFDILHGDVRFTFGSADVVYAHDVGVGDLGGDARLPNKTLAHFRGVVEERAKKFQGDGPV